MPSAVSNPAELTRRLDAVVDRVHEREPVGVGLEPLPGDAQSVLVAVEADEVDVGEPLQERLGVTAHPERRVDEDRTVSLEGRGEQLDAAVEEHGGVDVAQVHGCRDRCPQILIPIRSDLAPGKCVRA